MFNKLFCAFFILILWYITNQSFAAELKNKIVIGKGETRQQAIYNGLLNATTQIYGLSIQQMGELTQKNTQILSFDANGKPNIHEMTQNLNSIGTIIKSQTGLAPSANLIASWNINEENSTDKQVELSVSYYEYSKADPQNIKNQGKIRLVIAPLNTTDSQIETDIKYNFADFIHKQLTNYLIKSNRFTILERKDLDYANIERNLIQSNIVANQYHQNYAQVIGASWIFIPKIDKIIWKSSKKTSEISGEETKRAQGLMQFSYTIIDSASYEIIKSDTIKYEVHVKNNQVNNDDELINTTDSVGVQKFIGESVAEFANEVIDEIYPPLVIKVKNQGLVLNRGQKFTQVNDVWELFTPSEVIIDPQTNQELGSDLTSIGIMQINNISANYANGKLLSGELPSEMPTYFIAKRKKIQDEDKISDNSKNKATGTGLPSFLTRDYLKTTP